MRERTKKNLSPEHVAYSLAAERIRKGDDSLEAVEVCRVAEAAYRATLPKPKPTAPGWWNLPIAKAMWNGDSNGLSLAQIEEG